MYHFSTKENLNLNIKKYYFGSFYSFNVYQRENSEIWISLAYVKTLLFENINSTKKGKKSDH